MSIAQTTRALDQGAFPDALLALSAGGGPLDFDKTVLYQMALFMILMAVLKPLLFDPMMKIFALREERTDGAKAEARELQERAGELLKQYEVELVRVNQVAAEERQRLRNETAKLEAEILEEARQATTRIVDDGRRRINDEVNRIRFDLGKESERVSQQIVSRVLGREIN